MIIDFNFKSFADISTTKNDSIQLVVRDGKFFELSDQNLENTNLFREKKQKYESFNIQKNFIDEGIIGKQMENSILEKRYWNLFDISIKIMTVIAVTAFSLNAYYSYSLQPIWCFVNILQMVIHLPLVMN